MSATISRRAAPDVAAEEDRRFADLLRSLSPADWSTPTELPSWDVKAVACHVLGEAESHRIREALHQVLAGRKLASGRALVDGVNDVQIADRTELTANEILARLDVAAPRFRRFRARIPLPLRILRIPNPPHGWLPVGHLVDVVYTRDRWMHRVDICRAVGRSFEVDAEHDSRIVADVVAEWSAVHGRPYRLALDGPAGGVFARGDGGEEYHLDAVEFCRTVSGRQPGSGLLATRVVF